MQSSAPPVVLAANPEPRNGREREYHRLDSMKGSRSGRRRGPYVVLLAAIFAAAAGLAWSLSEGVLTQVSTLQPEPVAVSVTVIDARLDYGVNATVSGSLAAPQPVLATGAVGTVTDVLITPGAALRAGSELLAVNGLTIRAYVADTALYRTLTLGDSGPDVAVAQTVLSTLLANPSLQADGRFGPSTVRAVKQYEAMLGMTTKTGVFDPAWFARLPHDGYVVGAVDLQVGQLAPAAGEPLFEGPTSTLDVILRPETEQGGPDGSYLFAYQGEQIAVDKVAGEYRFTDQQRIEQLLAATDVGEDATDAEISGHLSLAAPVVGQAVPPSALLGSAQGDQCVLLSTDDTPVPTTVTIVGSAVDGMALIEAELPSDAQVIVNPGEVAPEATCR